MDFEVSLEQVGVIHCLAAGSTMLTLKHGFQVFGEA